MQKYEKLTETIMASAPCHENDALYNVRGELVSAALDLRGNDMEIF
jgi:hypothetical protein